MISSCQLSIQLCYWMHFQLSSLLRFIIVLLIVFCNCAPQSCSSIVLRNCACASHVLHNCAWSIGLSFGQQCLTHFVFELCFSSSSAVLSCPWVVFEMFQKMFASVVFNVWHGHCTFFSCMCLQCVLNTVFNTQSMYVHNQCVSSMCAMRASLLVLTVLGIVFPHH